MFVIECTKKQSSSGKHFKLKSCTHVILIKHSQNAFLMAVGIKPRTCTYLYYLKLLIQFAVTEVYIERFQIQSK